MLKAQDIFVLLKLVAMGPRPWSYAEMAVELGMSPSQVHAAIKRAMAVQLAVRKDEWIAPNLRNLEEFLIHGFKYMFEVQRGEMSRGMLTGYAAPPLVGLFTDTSSEPPPVWPDPDGEMRGTAFAPLCRHVPGAARKDRNLYELLVLLDAIRGGRAREKDFATKELQVRLSRYGQNL